MQGPSSLLNIVTNKVVVVGPNGQILVYNPTAGTGNLVSSITAQAFTDPYGNAVLAGDVTYVNFLGTSYALQINGITASYYTATSQAGPWTLVAQILYTTAPGTHPGLSISSASLTEKFDGTVPEFIFSGGNVRVGGGFVVAQDPNAFPTVDETWHSFAGSLLNGWATTAAGVAAYRLTNEGEIEFTGALNGGAATGVNITSIPAGPYRPAKTLTWPCGCSAGVIAGQSTFLQLSTGGTLFVNGLTPGTVSQAITLNGGGPLTGT